MRFVKERFGYHVVYDRDVYDAIDFAASHGFGYIVPDLIVPRFWPESLRKAERRKIRRHLDDHDVGISFHAPSDNLNLSTPYPEVRRGILRRMKKCLELARDLGAERFTIHPSDPPNFSQAGKTGSYLDDHYAIYAEALRGSIREMASFDEGLQICVENDPLSPFTEAVLEELMAETENLFLTLDIPKALDPSKGRPLERVNEFYGRNIERVREAHLHNRRPGGHFHDTLESGEVDLGSHLRTLAGRDVHYTLEIRPRESAYQSLLWLEGNWETLVK